MKGPGCAYRARLENLLTDMGVRDVRVMEFGTLDAIIGCVESGLGITLLPKSLLQAAAVAGRIRLSKVPSAIGEVETLFIRRRDCAEFSAMRALLADLVSDIPPKRARRGKELSSRVNMLKRSRK